MVGTEQKERKIVAPQPLLSREEFTKMVDEKYRRRLFIAEDVRDYVCSLPPEKAFALSRLLPKELMERLLTLRNVDTFVNNIIDYSPRVNVDGKFTPEIAIQVEEMFLVTHSAEFIRMLSGH